MGWMQPVYRLVGELLLHPDDRDEEEVVRLLERLPEAPACVRDPIEAFLAAPGAWSCDEYVQTLELSPPCPLYLGGYLFDEPTTCSGVGLSGRNGYMLELRAVYRHFGFEPSGRELPDYLPMVVDFLWVSDSHGARDRIGLRRRLVEQYVQPALEPLREALQKYDSPYAQLITALACVTAEDIRRMGHSAAWQPTCELPTSRVRRLPTVSDNGSPTPPGRNGISGEEVLP